MTARVRFSFAAALVLLTGCAGKFHITHGTNAKALQPNNVGVTAYAVEQKSTEGRIIDGCLDGIVHGGTHVIERARVSEMVKSNSIPTATEPTPQDIQKLGGLVNADGFIIVTAQGRMDLVANHYFVSSFSARLVDVQSGEEIRGVNFSDLESVDDGFQVASEACDKLMNAR